MDATAGVVLGCELPPSKEHTPNQEKASTPETPSPRIKSEPRSPQLPRASTDDPIDLTGPENDLVNQPTFIDLTSDDDVVMGYGIAIKEEIKEEDEEKKRMFLTAEPFASQENNSDPSKDDVPRGATPGVISGPSHATRSDSEEFPPRASAEDGSEADHIMREHIESEDESAEESDEMFLPEDSQEMSDDESPGEFVKSKKPKGSREWQKTMRGYITHQQERQPPRWNLQRKKDEISKLRSKVSGRVQKSNRGNGLKQRLKNYVDPRIFLGGGAENLQPSPPRNTEPHMKDVPNLKSSSKKLFKELFEKMAQHPELGMHKCKTEGNSLLKKSYTFGRGLMEKEDNGWRLKGMNAVLRHHQLIGTQFMGARECSQEGPFGGICADEMGLGKTVQTIATIRANPPSAEHIERNQKATLIVVPPALLSQWLKEIKLHDPKLGENTMIFKSSAEDNTATRMKNSDIVLTTYWELFNSIGYPSKETIRQWTKNEKLDLLEELERWTNKYKIIEEASGLLHQIDWYRIVLDEGHYIKNRASRTAWAAMKLQGECRWLLSGTPIMNHYEEFYPLLRFLREPLTMSLTHAKFCNSADPECVQALGILLSDLIIRRTMTDKIFDDLLVDLEQPIKSLGAAEAHSAENFIHRAVSKRFRELQQLHIKKEDPRYTLRQRFAQLTRLRQLVANIDIIGLQLMVMFTADELRKLQANVKEMRTRGQPKAFANVLYDRFTGWIQDRESEKYLSYIPREGEGTCMLCKEQTEDLKVIKGCDHTFCEICYDQHVALDFVDEVESVVCPKCGQIFDLKDVEAYETAAPDNGSKTHTKRAKDSRGFRTSVGKEQAYFQSLLQKFDAKDIDFLPSTKLITIMDDVKKSKKDAPKEKIIVFTQFRAFAIMLGSLLEKARIGFIYFTGDMNNKQRTKALERFEKDPKVHVMVAGLKCGGIGLNLTLANRVIISDIWWNVCVDNQAFGRVHRIGQRKQTYLTKITIKGTIDGKMTKIQEKKRKAIGTIMQDELTEEDWDDLLSVDFDDDLFDIGLDEELNEDVFKIH